MIYLLHHAIDQVAEDKPDLPAFRYDGESLSYAALRRQSNGLGARLLDLGIQRGDTVGLLLPKSLSLPVSVYGVLKAGGIHVPLDASVPAKRLARIIQNADIRCLIIAEGQGELVSRICREIPNQIRTVIGGDASVDSPYRQFPFGDIKSVDSAPEVRLTEDDPAYLLFTSGSTGQPKGIVHSHRGALAYARLAAETYNLTSDDRLGNFAPLHFDQSTFEFYAGPLRGACTVLIPQAYAIAVESLAQLIEAESLTVWYSVPSMLVQLLERGVLRNRDLSVMRWVLFGGEPFPPKLLAELMHLLPDASFSNVYGPTEVNQCTFFHLRPNSDLPEAIPIGRTWPNAEHLLLDEKDQPVAPGETGEYVVRTPTMMIGYWKQARPDNEIYYDRAEAGGLRSRFYRTGDLMKTGPDGLLEFQGRRDRQIKARGYRVELDEIETVLGGHSRVLEVGSYVVKDQVLGDRVEAAVRLRSGEPVSERDLKRHCAEILPAYARPHRIRILAELPRTRTGKIDRNALARATVEP